MKRRARGICRWLIVLSGGWAGLPAWGWSGSEHVSINYMAAQMVPDEMAAWRKYAYPLAWPGVFPDLWKDADPDEGPRHYFEPEKLRGLAVTNVPRDRAAFYQAVGQMAPEETGIAPWVIEDVRQMMIAAMRTNDWILAARCAAAMGHYVADLHQPLHCTENFDGWMSGQRGIHMRFESIMITTNRWNKRMIRKVPAAYLPDPFAATLSWVEESARQVPVVLAGDKRARQQAGGRTDTEEYYDMYWTNVSEMVKAQLSAAAQHLAAMWYTAWVDAGRPEIAAPPAELPDHSIHTPERHGPAPLDLTSKIYSAGLLLAAVVITILALVGLRKRIKAEDK